MADETDYLPPAPIGGSIFTPKSIGQLAYEAFREEDNSQNNDDYPLLSWEWLDLATQTKWEVVAETVLGLENGQIAKTDRRFEPREYVLIRGEDTSAMVEARVWDTVPRPWHAEGELHCRIYGVCQCHAASQRNRILFDEAYDMFACADSPGECPHFEDMKRLLGDKKRWIDRQG